MSDMEIKVKLDAGDVKVSGGGSSSSTDKSISTGMAQLTKSMAVANIVSEGILKGIDYLGKSLVESSGILKSVLKIFEMAMLVALKPLGDFIGSLLRPLAIYLLKMAIDVSKWIAGMLGGDQEGGVLETAKDLMEKITKKEEETQEDMPTDLSIITDESMKEIQETASNDLTSRMGLFAENFIMNLILVGGMLGALIIERIPALVDLIIGIFQMGFVNFEMIGAGILSIIIGLLTGIEVVKAVIDGDFARIPDIISEGINTILTGWGNVQTDMLTAMTNVIAGIVGIINPAWSETIKEWGGALVTQSKESITMAQNIVTELSSIPGKIAELIQGGIDTLGSILDDLLSQITIPDIGAMLGELTGYQTGTSYVPSDGMYYLHRGEQVASASSTGTNQTINVTAPINVNANVNNGMDASEVGYEVQRKMKNELSKVTTYGNSLF